MIQPYFLDTLGSPEVIGIASVAIASLSASFGFAGLVMKLAASERREEREVREKEAHAVEAVLEAFRELQRRAS